MMQTSASPAKQATVNARFLNMGGAASNCKRCDKRVYEMEKMVADTAVYHKACFRCTHCNGVLSLKNYTANGVSKLPYCKTHFIQLFREKGNYDEGFGMERNAKAVGKGDMVDSPNKSYDQQSPVVKNNFKLDKSLTTASPLTANRFVRDEMTDVHATGVEPGLREEESDLPEEGSTKSLIASFQSRHQVTGVESPPQKPAAKQQVKLIDDFQEQEVVVAKSVIVATPVQAVRPQQPVLDDEDDDDDYLDQHEVMHLHNDVNSHQITGDHPGDDVVHHHEGDEHEEHNDETEEDSNHYHHDNSITEGYRAGNEQEDCNSDEEEQQVEKEDLEKEDESYESHGRNVGEESEDHDGSHHHEEYHEEFYEESEEKDYL